MRDLLVPENPQITTAIGAAHMAMAMYSKSGRKLSDSNQRLEGFEKQAH